MGLEEGVIHIDIATLFGIMIGIIIPIILFWWRLHYVTKRTLDMHHEPDKYGFGTGATNALLTKHMEDETDMHRKSITAIEYLTHTIRELSHYTRWLAKEQTGKAPPPFVRNGRKPS